MKKSKLKVAIVVIVTLGLIVAGVLLYLKGRSGTGQNQNNLSSQPSSEAELLLSDNYDYYGTLAAVDESDTFGEAGFEFIDQFELKANINNLADPQTGYFYEGWLVDPTVEGKFVSTGKLNKENDIWVNTFISPVDYTSYTKYVLTIEPDDGDPAPAKHVAEGDLTKNGTTPTVKTQPKNGYVSLADYQADQSAYNSGDVVLFFNATWCPTCKVLNQSLTEQADEFPTDLTIVNVNYDEATELKSKYGVTYQHTLVQIDADSNQVKKWSGGGDLQSITDQLQ